MTHKYNFLAHQNYGMDYARQQTISYEERDIYARALLTIAAADAQTPGPVIAHFRSEQAALANGEGTGARGLMLWGRIAQAAYPGGFWRYAVAVGEQKFLVDDPRRFTVGEEVRIRLPAEALYIYPDEARANTARA